jgi:hypothetical protein
MIEPTEKEAVKKCQRNVQVKFKKLDYTNKELSFLPREDLLDQWAKAVLTSKDRVAPSGTISSKVFDEVEQERIVWKKHK